MLSLALTPSLHLHVVTSLCLCVCGHSVVSDSLRPHGLCQAPLSMGFPRQEYWSGLACPPPGDLPDPGIGPVSPESPALVGGFFTTELPREPTNLEAHSSLVQEFIEFNLYFLSLPLVSLLRGWQVEPKCPTC